MFVKHCEGDELNTSQGTAGPLMKEVQSNTNMDIVSDNVVLSREDELNRHGQQTAGQPKGKRSDTCHQCHKNNKVIGLWCNKCRMRYCISCISRWYPAIKLTVTGLRLEVAESLQSCPSCCNICNCGACLQSAMAASKVVEIQGCQITDLNHSHINFHKGQPIMVDNVLKRAFGLSWEPSVLERAFRKFKREGDYSMDVVNCCNWYEEKVHAYKFFIGYYNGMRQGRGEPKILRTEIWLYLASLMINRHAITRRS